jgi:hypothetical protein
VPHLLDSVPEQRRGECWWLVLRDGTPIAGDRGGGVTLMAAIRLTRPLGRASRRLGLSPVMEALDRLVSRYRKQLGRLVPGGDAPRRYP